MKCVYTLYREYVTFVCSLRIYKGSVLADSPQASSPPPSLAEKCANVSQSELVVTISDVPVAGAGETSRFMKYIDVPGFDFSCKSQA